MHCPICHHPDTKVIDSRLLLEGDSIRRRRQCSDCSHRFTTYERFQPQLPMLIKSDGRRENFDPEKIMRGLKKACQKRPIAVSQLEGVIESVQRELAESDQTEISAENVGEIVMRRLYQLDPVSYVRFASFYWDYSDIEDFVKSLQKQNKTRPKTKSKKLTTIKDQKDQRELH